MERLRIHLDQNVASLHQQAFLVILAHVVASYFETNLGVDVADRNSNPLRMVRYLILIGTATSTLTDGKKLILCEQGLFEIRMTRDVAKFRPRRVHGSS
jgi:hypothetical protein